MMSTEFNSLLEQAKADFDRLRCKTPVPIAEAEFPKCPGIYVFYENGVPLRVGTTRNLRARVRQHYGNNHRSAAFSKQLARAETEIVGTFRPGGWKTQIQECPRLLDAFQAARCRIRGMCVGWLEVPNPDVRYLLEFYAAKDLNTPHNDFRET